MTAGGTIEQPLTEAAGTGRESCVLCWRRTVAAQRASLVASAHWLSRVARTPDNTPLPAPPAQPCFALCRAVPDCVGLGCEAPLRRDPAAEAELTRLVGEVFLSTLPGDSRWLAVLLSSSIRQAECTGHVPCTTDPRLGPVAIHSAVVANNLLSSAWPGFAAPPSVQDGNAARASEPSLRSLELLLHPAAPDAVPSAGAAEFVCFPRPVPFRPPSGADLLAVELFNRSLERLGDNRAGFGPTQSVTAGSPQSASGQLSWWRRLLRALGLWRGNSPEDNRPSVMPLPPFIIPPEAQEIHERFVRCDLLHASASGFASTPLQDPARAAVLLRGLRHSPDANLVLPRICQGLVAVRAENDLEWLAILGTLLLEDDPDSAGAEVSSFLLMELIAHGQGEPLAWDRESSRLWSWLVQVAKPQKGNEDTADAVAEKSDGPQWLVRLCRRAAALQAQPSKARHWERLVTSRMVSIVALIWGGPPLANPDWQQLLLRSLELFLNLECHQSPVPAGTGCGLAELAKHALHIREALEQQGAEASSELRALVERVWSLPRFPHWSRYADAVVPTLASPRTEFDEYFFRNFDRPTESDLARDRLPPLEWPGSLRAGLAPGPVASTGPFSPPSVAGSVRPTGKGKKKR